MRSLYLVSYPGSFNCEAMHYVNSRVNGPLSNKARDPKPLTSSAQETPKQPGSRIKSKPKLLLNPCELGVSDLVLLGVALLVVGRGRLDPVGLLDYVEPAALLKG